MNWINGFEIMCYILTVILIADMLRKKNIAELKLFASGAIAGYVLELLTVSVTDIYYYNPGFWLNLGRVPYQFPVFGGLMWGGLTVCALRISERMNFGKVMTAFCTGMLIVSMDILLDVAAIRLDGGFWTWEGRAITTEVTHHIFMSVIWVNFLGYMLETPMVTWLALKDRDKGDSRPFHRHVLATVLNALGGIGFVGAGSLLALWLNSVTDEWFAFVAFIILWVYVLIRIILQFLQNKPVICPRKKQSLLAVLFFSAMYVYCFAGLISLGIFIVHPWFFVLGLLLFAGSVLIGISEFDLQ